MIQLKLRCAAFALAALALAGLTVAVPTADVHAQDVMTIEQAIQIALENNVDAQIARREAEIARNNRSLGNAGFLPQVGVAADRTEAFSGSAESRDDLEIAGRVTTDVEASAGWTVFDGLRMFAAYDRLTAQARLGEVEAGIVIEQTVAATTFAYYDIVRVEQRLRALRNSVEISEERQRIAEEKVDLGSASEYDLLLARADLNADRAAVLREEASLESARLRLLDTVNLPPDFDFSVEADIPIGSIESLEALDAAAEANNLLIAAAALGSDVFRHALSELRRSRFPEIDLTAGYGIGTDDNRATAAGRYVNEGYRYGITARLSLFDGLNTRRQIQNARIELTNQELRIEDARSNVETQLRSEYVNFENATRLVALETENIAIADRSVEIALQRFTLGTTTAIELREVQRTRLETETRLIAALYEAKVAETELMRLSGRLLGL